MITLGVILLIISLVTGVMVLKTLGVLLVLVGVVLVLLGSAGRAVGGRRHYW
ncbi:MAG: hypothetical protein H7227_01560 [Actinobacteria bacterium]|nr:hypothetical protein [Actinomycetota bacterium]